MAKQRTLQKILEGEFFLIAGPCVIENEHMPIEIAQAVKNLGDAYHIPVVFKASYRKANRSSINSFTGIGDEAGLKVLKRISDDFDMPVTTDVHSAIEAHSAGDYVDIIQIPAFLCRQTDILLAAAGSGKIVNIKKGQFMSPESMKFAVEKVQSVQSKIMLTERGTSFGYKDLVVDFTAIKKMQGFCQNVVVDCTHALQRPNQSSGVTGGKPEMIESIALAGTAVGANGLFIEVHPNPSEAKSDGANMLILDKLEPLLEKIVKIREAIK